MIINITKVTLIRYIRKNLNIKIKYIVCKNQNSLTKT